MKYFSQAIEGIDIQMPEPIFSNVREITIAKLRYADHKIRQSVVVSDAGFYIESLNGFPGAYVNFILDTIGIEGLLRLTHGRSRRCSFEECLGYICAPENMYSSKCRERRISGTRATRSYAKACLVRDSVDIHTRWKRKDFSRNDRR